ncbi:MAG: glutamine-hydrolyzing GMP synthase, partial [Pseudomonadota bacterium]
MEGGVLILDFGSQVTQLIARRLRELNVYSELHPFNVSLETIRKKRPKAIILSGGPLSVNDESSPKRDLSELAEIAPLMGICYGMQLMAQQNGGIVEKATVREYGKKEVSWDHAIADVPKEQTVWMSHGDVVKVPPPGFKVLAKSDEGHPAALENDNLFAVQFHPEVSHTDAGTEVLRYFVFEKAKVEANWKPDHIVTDLKRKIRDQVGEDEHVIVGLSGGVDSTVAARLVTKALGQKRVHCYFINNGLLRKGEYEEVLDRYKGLGLNVSGVDAEKVFLMDLA